MKKKYTMEEFEEMFEKATIDTIDKLLKDFKEADKEEKINPLAEFAFNMQNAMVISELHKELFKESE